MAEPHAAFSKPPAEPPVALAEAGAARPRTRLLAQLLALSRPVRSWPLPLQYLGSLAVMFLAAAGRLSFDAVLNGYPFLFFLPAVLLVAFVFERGPALVASAASAAAAVLLFLVPAAGRTASDAGAWLAVGVYLGVALLIASTVEALRLAHEEARAGEARYRAVFESVSVGMVQVGFDDARYLQVNGAMCRLLGYPRETLLQMCWTAVSHPDDIAADMAQFRRMAHGEIDEYAMEKRLLRQDGTVVWVRLTLSLVRDGAGRPVCEIGIVEDISERRCAEQALAAGNRASAEAADRVKTALAESHRSGALLRAFIEAVPAVVYAKDREGRMLVANEATARVLGIPLQGVIGRTQEDLVRNPDQVAAIRANDSLVLERGERVQFEEVLAGPDGSTRTWLSTKAPFRDAAGQVIGLVGASVDISERKRAEAVLARGNDELSRLVEERTAGLLRASDERRRAEEAMRQGEKLRALGQLTGGIAHDFNNLLQVVSSGIALLRMPALEPQRREGVLDGMARAARTAGDLTRRLLSFARQRALKSQVLDLNERVSAFAELLRPALGSRIEVRTRLAPELPHVQVDPSQLETAMLNLAVNARDAMPDGGILTLETVKGDGPHVVLRVIDTGMGMTPEVRDRLFEPFFTTKPAGEGTGLGLSQVHGFLQQSGGDLQVDSTPGQGACFTLLLPATLERVPTPVATLPAARSESRSVLVVDDNAEVAAFVGTLLGELGYRVRQAHSAEQALEVLRQEPADAVFSDIVMPGGGSGLDLARAIARDHPETAVVLATGYAEQLSGAAVVPWEVLAKPYVLDDVAQALQRAFGRVAAETPG